jgi:hypothetical protein
MRRMRLLIHIRTIRPTELSTTRNFYLHSPFQKPRSRPIFIPKMEAVLDEQESKRDRAVCPSTGRGRVRGFYENWHDQERESSDQERGVDHRRPSSIQHQRRPYRPPHRHNLHRNERLPRSPEFSCVTSCQPQTRNKNNTHGTIKSVVCIHPR